jgi:hypothetical protein
MSDSKTTVMDKADANTKAVNATDKTPKTVDPSLQAGWLDSVGRVVDWAWKNRKLIASILAGIGVDNIVSFVKSLFSPKGSEEYKSMTDAGRKSVDSYSNALGKAFENGDKAAVVSNLKQIAKVYEQQAKIAEINGDANTAAKLRTKAGQVSSFAENIENGNIPMDAGITTRVKDESKKDEGQETKNESQEKSLILTKELVLLGLNSDLQKLLRLTLKILNVPELTDKNAQAVAQKLLELGAGEKVTEQIFTAYYQNVKGLSPSESQEKAKEIVEAAKENANSKNQTKENGDNEAGEKAAAVAKQTVEQGMGGM